MNFKESFMTRNPHYQANVKFRPCGISLMTIHKAQPSAKVLMSNQNNEKCRSLCPHAIIDHTGTIYHTLPWNVQGPDSSDNIVILLSEPGDIKYEKDGSRTIGNLERAVMVEERIYQAAVELCAQLCCKKGFDPKVSIQFLAKPESVDKLWNALKMGKTADDFVEDVAKSCSAIQEAMNASKKQGDSSSDSIIDTSNPVMPAPIPEPVYLSVAPKPIPEPPKTYQVRIDVERLRIRSSPEVTPNNITGKYTGKGVFTITEIQNGSGSTKGWGKLESGGWISLDHVVIL